MPASGITGGSEHATRPDCCCKSVSDQILTFLHDRLPGGYSVAALKRIAFGLSSNDFHFDTEIILQLFSSGQRIVELPIPTYYGDEICRVNGIGYAFNVMAATLRWKIGALGLLTDAKYERRRGEELYEPKLDFPSTHS